MSSGLYPGWTDPEFHLNAVRHEGRANISLSMRRTSREPWTKQDDEILEGVRARLLVLWKEIVLAGMVAEEEVTKT